MTSLIFSFWLSDGVFCLFVSWESAHTVAMRIKSALLVFVLAIFIQTLSWFIFLVISILVSQVCKIFLISHWDWCYSSTKSKSSFENVSTSPFFSFISLSGIRVCSLYMSCIWSCYLRWIMSRQVYRYSSEHGSWSCFY